MTELEIRQLAVQYAWSLVTTPYEWGGDNPQGLDCSGFMGEVYRGIGLLASHEDLTSQGFADKFREYKTQTPHVGGFVVFGSSSVTHIALLINEETILEASGGGSKTKTLNDADRTNGFVKMRPLSTRSDILGLYDPIRKLRP